MPATLTPLNTGSVRKEINKVSPSKVALYLQYWGRMVPRNHKEYYHLWLFAFMSIRTRWETNVELYKELRKLPPDFSSRQVRGVMNRLRGGLTDMRVIGISRFRRDFWRNPQEWYVQPGEDFADARDRLVDKTYGLGLAKTAFVLEMAYPRTCQVVCVDTHIKQLYGLEAENSINDRLYRRMERHWLGVCAERGLASAQVRNIYWDELRGEPSTRYWSYCLERRGFNS